MKNKGIFYSLLVMLLWGTLFPMVKKGYSFFGASTSGDFLTFAGVRFIICGIIICIYVFIKNKSAFKPVKNNLFMIIIFL